MSAPTNDGGPAFPLSCKPMAGDLAEWGMSIRDYFAGQALAGKCGFPSQVAVTTEILAFEAYRIADAMLEAQNTQSSKP